MCETCTHMYAYCRYTSHTCAIFTQYPHIYNMHTHTCTLSTHMYVNALLLLSHSVVSDSVQPHRQQPTRLPRPWDSPGKNTGVGCHFLLQCIEVKSESEVAQSCPTLRPHGLQPTRLLHPWDFPGKSTGVGCHCLLWGV